jgi:hypothetical protein
MLLPYPREDCDIKIVNSEGIGFDTIVTTLHADGSTTDDGLLGSSSLEVLSVIGTLPFDLDLPFGEDYPF